MLVALAAATFAVTGSGTALSPFLQDAARDLKSSLTNMGHLFAILSVTWGLFSLVVGTFAARIGRRLVLVTAVLVMAATRVGFALSPDYVTAAIWQTVSGACGGAFMGTVFAAVSEHIAPQARGRALSSVIAGQSLSLVIGVPLVSFFGIFTDWRGATIIYAALTAITAIGVRLLMPPDAPEQTVDAAQKTSFSTLAQPRLIALLLAGTTERVCFGIVAIFLPTCLQRGYDASLAQIGFALAIIASGNLIGNLVGGRIADRTQARSVVFAVSLATTAVFAIPTLMWTPAFALSILFGFAYCFANAAGRPALMAILGSMPPDIRGALFGLNITTASIGWLLAGSAGGILIETTGFSGLALFCAGLALVGAMLSLASGTIGRRVNAT